MSSKFVISSFIVYIMELTNAYPSKYGSNCANPPITTGLIIMGASATSAPLGVKMSVTRNGTALISGASYVPGENLDVTVTGGPCCDFIFQTDIGVYNNGACSGKNAYSQQGPAAGLTVYNTAILVAPLTGNLNIWGAYSANYGTVSVIPTFTLIATPNVPSAETEKTTASPSYQSSLTVIPTLSLIASLTPTVFATGGNKNIPSALSEKTTASPSNQSPPSFIPTVNLIASLSPIALSTGITTTSTSNQSSRTNITSMSMEHDVNHASCFAGTELIELESGLKIQMSEVMIGDKIKSFSIAANAIVFSDVIYIPHQRNDILTSFQQITTTTGKSIKLTPGHLILSRNCDLDTKMVLMEAALVDRGKCILTIDGEEAVVDNVIIVERGIYTLVIQHDYIVVSDVIASPFAKNHFIPNLFYSFHSVLYSFMPNLLKTKFIQNIGDVADEVAVHIMNEYISPNKVY